ncbi:hypothetical protein G7Y41_00575 [Schaalia sp. ZJ405]|uniref:homing endonuclease associated repeat-containing protein n=1 Tax=Schaalia sp. ZJ405 TaxID=2709403 RepID=UPI0013EC593B|nr:hypothetical protein [Schaalia sp. ZJ405]QPK81411.1 hypothetical protein G7Y41_00575 [Schaalia sp. ZJ405]
MSESAESREFREAVELLDDIRSGRVFVLTVPAHVRTMFAAFVSGASLESLAHERGMSVEQVREMLEDALEYSLEQVIHARSIEKMMNREKERRNTEQRVLEWSHTHEGVSLKHAVSDLGMSLDEIKRYLGDRRFFHLEGTRRSAPSSAIKMTERAHPRVPAKKKAATWRQPKKRRQHQTPSPDAKESEPRREKPASAAEHQERHLRPFDLDVDKELTAVSNAEHSRTRRRMMRAMRSEHTTLGPGEILRGILSRMAVFPECSPRVRRLLDEYLNGTSIIEIGRTWNLPPATVREILSRATPFTLDDIRRARDFAQKYDAATKRKQLRQRVLEWSETHVGIPLSQAESDLDLDIDDIENFIGWRAVFHKLWVDSSGNRYGSDDLVKLLTPFTAFFQARELLDRVRSGGAIAENQPEDVHEMLIAYADGAALDTLSRDKGKDPEQIRALLGKASPYFLEEIRCAHLIENVMYSEYVHRSEDLRSEEHSKKLTQSPNDRGKDEAGSGIASVPARKRNEDRELCASWPALADGRRFSDDELHEIAAPFAAFLEVRDVLHGIRSGEAISLGVSALHRQMLVAYSEGQTLESLGEQRGITRERVRQILTKASPYPLREIRHARTLEAQMYAECVHRIEKYRVIEWSQSHIGVPLTQAVSDLGIPLAQVRKHIGRRKYLHDHRKRMAGPLYDDEQLLDLLRTFHEETGSFSSDQFDRWSTARGGPTKQVVIIRFQKWSQALRRAGLNGGKQYHRIRLYTDEDCWAALVEFIRSGPERITFDNFAMWLQDQPLLPSAALIRNRIREPWYDMLRTVVMINAGETEGMDPTWVQEVTRVRDWQAQRNQRKRTIDADSLIVRAYQDLGYPLTCARYNQWAKDRGEPVAALVMKHAQVTWNELLQRAGIPLSRHRNVYTRDDAVSAVTEYLVSGGDPRFEAYQAWARDKGRMRPDAISRIYGSWKLAIASIREGIAQNEKEASTLTR